MDEDLALAVVRIWMRERKRERQTREQGLALWNGFGYAMNRAKADKMQGTSDRKRKKGKREEEDLPPRLLPLLPCRVGSGTRWIEHKEASQTNDSVKREKRSAKETDKMKDDGWTTARLDECTKCLLDESARLVESIQGCGASSTRKQDEQLC